GRDRFELTANRSGGIGLQIEAFVLRQAAGEENVDDRPRLLGGSRRTRRERTQCGEVVHAQAQNTRGTGLNCRASRERWVLRQRRFLRCQERLSPAEGSRVHSRVVAQLWLCNPDAPRGLLIARYIPVTVSIIKAPIQR